MGVMGHTPVVMHEDRAHQLEKIDFCVFQLQWLLNSYSYDKFDCLNVQTVPVQRDQAFAFTSNDAVTINYGNNLI